MAAIRFVLNGQTREVDGRHPTTTVLNYLRGTERLTGTKEGCAEGDCGACTVILAEPDGKGGLSRRSLNACILFLPALNGRAIETVEHLGQGGPNPVQAAMVEQHGSQCGFCTPGFVMQLQAGWRDGKITDRQSVKDLVSGNLCRCTGYGPIVEAGLSLAAQPIPDTAAADRAIAAELAAMPAGPVFETEGEGGVWLSPATVDDLADTYAAHPDATLVAGATDVGLWVTKQHRDLPVLIDVSRVAELSTIEDAGGRFFIGAAVTHAKAYARLARLHPDLGELMRRFAGGQVRNAGTVGGNVANGSPIGDLPPALIALGATLHLRCGDAMREMPIEDFFVAYGKQNRRPGEFVAAIEVPELTPNARFHVSKISKRLDSDISAVLAAFRLAFDGDIVADVRLAFGGMAGTPMRARKAEAALLGRAFDAGACRDAMGAMAEDFAPLSDMRASASYRLTVAQNTLERFRLSLAGTPVSIAAFA